MMARHGLALSLCLLLAAGCSTSVAPAPGDGGGVTDAGSDAGTDGGVTDAGTPDAGTDGGVTDAGTDGGVTDAGTPDAGTDGGVTDAGTSDAGTTDAGVTDAGVTDAGIPDAGTDGGTPAAAASVLEHHNDLARDGVYVVPALTHAVAAHVHLDAAFHATVTGDVRAQPLYLAAAAAGGRDLLLVVTEADAVYGLDPATGAVVWSKTLGTPAPRSDLPCGNIFPLGITGTPVVDPATRTLYLDAMIDVAGVPHHRVFALDADTGATKGGWPVDVDTAVGGFTSAVQNERGALALVSGILYVPYGGHYGDCGDYHGWLVGISTTDPTQVKAWSTAARGGGMWAVGGVASDGTHLWTATGNTFGVSTWSGGEAVLRFGAGPVFGNTAADYFAPTNWTQLDAGDVDIGGSAPVLFDDPASTPSHLTIALGKNGVAYLLDRDALGGIGGELYQKTVASDEIIQAATAYHTAKGTYVAFRGTGVGCPSGQYGSLTALKIVSGSPPSFTVAWCAPSGGRGSPMFTTTGGGADPIVWSIGAEGDQRLHGYDGDTGAVVFGGGGAGDVMGTVHRFQTPIVAGGRIYVGGNGAVYAFTF